MEINKKCITNSMETSNGIDINYPWFKYQPMAIAENTVLSEAWSKIVIDYLK